MTTWVMQAVAINNETGLGLATPLRILSRKDFFVSLKMPYSVKRGEQVSLLVTAFNYVEEELQVCPEGCTCDGKVTSRLAWGEVRVSSRIKKKKLLAFSRNISQDLFLLPSSYRTNVTYWWFYYKEALGLVPSISFLILSIRHYLLISAYRLRLEPFASLRGADNEIRDEKSSVPNYD